MGVGGGVTWASRLLRLLPVSALLLKNPWTVWRIMESCCFLKCLIFYIIKSAKFISCLTFSSASNNIVGAKDHASIQINIAEVRPVQSLEFVYRVCGLTRRLSG